MPPAAYRSLVLPEPGADEEHAAAIVALECAHVAPDRAVRAEVRDAAQHGVKHGPRPATRLERENPEQIRFASQPLPSCVDKASSS